MFEARHQLIIVTPVYEDTEACTELLQHLGARFGETLYVVLVDDGSVRQPLRAQDIPEQAPDCCIVSLRRNVGHQRAIATGLSLVAAQLQAHQRLILMDCDGEDSPEACTLLLQRLDPSTSDIVVAQRRKRSESLRFRVFYMAYKGLFRAATGRSIDFGNFMAMTPASARRLTAMSELPIHVAGTALASKLRIERAPVDRSTRYQGRSKMNFQSLVLHGLKAIMVFAEDFLVRIGLACLIVAFVAALCILAAIGIKLTGVPTPGWFSVTLGILVLISLQAGTLTLLALMLNGVLKNTPVAGAAVHAENIDSVQPIPRRSAPSARNS